MLNESSESLFSTKVCLRFTTVFGCIASEEKTRDSGACDCSASSNGHTRGGWIAAPEAKMTLLGAPPCAMPASGGGGPTFYVFWEIFRFSVRFQLFLGLSPYGFMS